VDKEIIRAYLWQAMVRTGFRPSGTKDQKRWLQQYCRSIKDFWELSSYPSPPTEQNGKIKGSLDCAEPTLLLDYEVSLTAEKIKFAVRFLYRSHPNSKEVMWVHDVDGKFFCFQPHPFLSHHNKDKAALRESADEDIEAVVEGLIIHPAVHQHIESPIPHRHEIRIGGGIDNPFLFLFHLRYQLCPIQKKREAERRRLIELFRNAIRLNSSVSVSELMAQP